MTFQGREESVEWLKALEGGDSMHLPTKAGYYWVLEDLGITNVYCVCWVNPILPDSKISQLLPGVYLLSPWSTYSEPLPHAPEFHHKQWVKWDPARHLAWEGPLERPPTMINVRTGQSEKVGLE